MQNKHAKTPRGLLVLMTVLLSALLLIGAGAAEGIDITAETKDISGEGWTYTAADKTLTLNGASLDYIFAEGTDLTLMLLDTNTIFGGKEAKDADGDPYRFGINVVKGDLVFHKDSTGTLMVTVDDTVSDYDFVDGVAAYHGSVIVNGGGIVIVSGAFDDAYGLSAEYGDVIINGGSVVSAALGNDDAYGISAEYGSVTVNGGTLTVSTAAQNKEDYAYGIYADNGLEINGGAHSFYAEADFGYGLYTASDKAEIKINGGTISATGTTQAVYAESGRLKVSSGIAAKAFTEDTEAGSQEIKPADAANPKYLSVIFEPGGSLASSPAPVLGLLLGGLAVAALLRRE